MQQTLYPLTCTDHFLHLNLEEAGCPRNVEVIQMHLQKLTAYFTDINFLDAVHMVVKHYSNFMVIVDTLKVRRPPYQLPSFFEYLKRLVDLTQSPI